MVSLCGVCGKLAEKICVSFAWSGGCCCWLDYRLALLDWNIATAAEAEDSWIFWKEMGWRCGFGSEEVRQSYIYTPQVGQTDTRVE